MKSRPILFSAPMIKALLAGAKTQTRRILKPQPKGESLGLLSHPQLGGHFAPHVFGSCLAKMGKSPYGVAGDRLWCRETWRAVELRDGTDRIRFAADQSFQRIEATAEAADRWVVAYDNGRHFDRWRPSIFMPRWASRLTLDITNVRVERLHDISEEDAKAEGAESLATIRDVREPFSFRDGFAKMWRSINGAESWDANPWCWCLTFRRIDAVA